MNAQDDDLERGRQLASWRDDLIAQGVDPSTLAIPADPGAPIDWDDLERWGQLGHNRHEATWAPDGTHDDDTDEDR